MTFEINVRMNWGEAAKILIAALMDSDPKDRRSAAEEVMNMARAADLAVAQEKLVKALQERLKTMELRNRIAVGIVERFLLIDDWDYDSIAPRLLVSDALELVKVAKVGRS